MNIELFYSTVSKWKTIKATAYFPSYVKSRRKRKLSDLNRKWFPSHGLKVNCHIHVTIQFLSHVKVTSFVTSTRTVHSLTKHSFTSGGEKLIPSVRKQGTLLFFSSLTSGLLSWQHAYKTLVNFCLRLKSNLRNIVACAIRLRATRVKIGASKWLAKFNKPL